MSEISRDRIDLDASQDTSRCVQVSDGQWEIRIFGIKVAEILDMGASWYGGLHYWQIRPTDETLKKGIAGSSGYKSSYEAFSEFMQVWNLKASDDGRR